jgi:hypothetical protein
MNITRKEVVKLIIKSMIKNPGKWICVDSKWKILDPFSTLIVDEKTLKVSYVGKEIGAFDYLPGFWNKGNLRKAIENLKGCKIALSLEEKRANKIPFSRTFRKSTGNTIVIGVND